VAADRLQIVRECYEAFASGDRETIERHFAEEMEFSAPPDPSLDRAGYFERCWPHSGQGQSFDFVRLQEISGDAVLVTYESTKRDGKRGRNTEILTFRGDGIVRQEVYWGWDL
jgi:ketosteroid isomerase-like protein